VAARDWGISRSRVELWRGGNDFVVISALLYIYIYAHCASRRVQQEERERPVQFCDYEIRQKPCHRVGSYLLPESAVEAEAPCLDYPLRTAMDPSTTIYSHSLAIMRLFRNLQTLCQDIMEGDWKTMQLSCEVVGNWLQEPYLHLKAWATSIAALHPPHLKSSLDFRLREAVQIREQVLKLLRTLHESLMQGQSSNPIQSFGGY
jgi:hypothetical protein